MKSRNKKTQKSASRFESIMFGMFESFIRKTDSDKRIALFGGDPFRN